MRFTILLLFLGLAAVTLASSSPIDDILSSNNASVESFIFESSDSLTSPKLGNTSQTSREPFPESFLYLAKSGVAEENLMKSESNLDKELTFDDDPILGFVALSGNSSSSKGSAEEDAEDKVNGGRPKGVVHMGSDVKLSGCYTNVSKSLKLVYDGKDVTVIRCAAHCSNRGYPIAATSQGTKCYCAYDYPNFDIPGYVCANSNDIRKNGIVCDAALDASVSCPGGKCIRMEIGPQCNAPCAGVYPFFSSTCRGSYCCGDLTGKYFSVATVGNLNPVRQLMRRLAMNLSSEEGRLTHKVFANAFILEKKSSINIPVSFASGWQYQLWKAEQDRISQYGYLGNNCKSKDVDWAQTFSTGSWGECPTHMALTGLYRLSCDTLGCLTKARCMSVCAGTEGMGYALKASSCYQDSVNWAATFTTPKTWSSCKQDTFITGLLSNNSLITGVKCCTLSTDVGNAIWWDCQISSWGTFMSKNLTWSLSEKNLMVVGLYRDNCSAFSLSCLSFAKTCGLRVVVKQTPAQQPQTGFEIGPDSPRAAKDFNNDDVADILYMDAQNSRGVIYWGPGFQTYQVINLPAMSWIPELVKMMNEKSQSASTTEDGSTLSQAPTMRNVARKYKNVYQTSTPDKELNARKCVDGQTTLGTDRSFCFGGWAPSSWRVDLKSPAYVQTVNIYTTKSQLFNMKGCSVRMIPDVDIEWKIISEPYTYTIRTSRRNWIGILKHESREVKGIRTRRVAVYPGEKWFSINTEPVDISNASESKGSTTSDYAFLAERGLRSETHAQWLKKLADSREALIAEESRKPLSNVEKSFEELFSESPVKHEKSISSSEEVPSIDFEDIESLLQAPNLGKIAVPDQDALSSKAESKANKGIKESEKKVENATRPPVSYQIQQSVQIVNTNMTNIRAVEIFCKPGWRYENSSYQLGSMLAMFEVEILGLELGPATIAVGDVTGDGITDIVSISPIGTYLMDYGKSFYDKANSKSLYPIQNLAISPATPVLLSGVSQARANGYENVLADVNGDTKDDLISFRPKGFDVLLSSIVTDPTTNAPTPTLTLDESWTKDDFSHKQGYKRSPILIVDINKDGCMDMVRINVEDSNRMYLKKSNCAGTFFSPVPMGRFSGPEDEKIDFLKTPYFFADVTGDQFKDICRIGAGHIDCMFNDGTGNGFGAEQTVMSYDGDMFIDAVSTAVVAKAYVDESNPTVAPTPTPLPTGKSTPTPTSKSQPTEAEGIKLSSTEAEIVRKYDKLYLISQPGDNIRVLYPRKLTIEPEDVRIELNNSYDSKTYYTTQMVTSDRSFRRLTVEDYKEEYRMPPPTILNSILELTDIIKVELNNPPKSSEYLNTHDIVLENNTSVTQTMSKDYSDDFTSSFTFSADHTFPIAIKTFGSFKAFGAGGELEVKLTVGITISLNFSYDNTSTSGFSMDVNVPPGKTYSVRYKQETKDIFIRWKGSYVAKGDVVLRVFQEGRPVYMQTAHFDELLALEQRMFSMFGTISAGSRKQYKAEIMEVTDTLPRTATDEELLDEKNLTHCGTAHEKYKQQVFSTKNGNSCTGGSARLYLNSYTTKTNAVQNLMHPALQHIVQKHILDEDRPTVVHQWKK